MRLNHVMFPLMFGALWSMLLLQIVFNETSSYSILTEHISRETNRVSEESNDIVKDYLEMALLKENEVRMLPSYQHMDNVRRHCTTTIHYLDSVRNRIAEAAGGYLPDSFKLSYPEDRKWWRKVFGGKDGVLALLYAVDSLNEYMILNVNFEDYRDNIRNELPSKWCDCSWAEQEPGRIEMQRFFHYSTAAAAVAMLTAIEHRIRLSEKLILQELYWSGMPKGPSYFDAIACLAVPVRSFVTPGMPASALIFVAEYNKSMTFHSSCSEGRITEIKYGIAIWKDRPRSVGLHRVYGRITSDEDTVVKDIAWEFWYRSIVPHANLQIDQMNVLYRGIDNPVSVSASAGYEVKDLSLFVPHAIVTLIGPGKYNIQIKAKAVKRLYVLIIHTDRNGKRDTISGMPLTVKDLPRPVATIGNENNRSPTAEELRQSSGLLVFSPDEDLDISYGILSYTVSFIRKGSTEITGPILIRGSQFAGNPDLDNLLREMGKGDRVLFTDIKATAPDGSITSPTDISYRLE